MSHSLKSKVALITGSTRVGSGAIAGRRRRHRVRKQAVGGCSGQAFGTGGLMRFQSEVERGGTAGCCGTRFRALTYLTARNSEHSNTVD